MKKIIFISLLFLILLSRFVIADEYVMAKIYISSFTLTELKDMRKGLINYSKNHPQPAGRYSALLNVSTNTRRSGLLYTDYMESIKIDSESREVLIILTSGILNLPKVQDYINEGRIDIVSIFRNDEWGYIRDANFRKMQKAYKDFRDKWSYKVVISTP